MSQSGSTLPGQTPITFPVTVPKGGTGDTSFTAYAVITGGTTSTSSLQSVASLGTSGQVLTSNGAGALPSFSTVSGFVTSVSGTANRITSSGGASPVIDISSSYAGQTSIVTVGSVTTGTWVATTINVPYGGTGAVTLTNHGVLIGQGTSSIAATSAGSTGQVLQSSGAAADPTYSTATYPSTATGTGTILRANGTNWVATTATYPNTAATGDLIYGSTTNVISSLAIGADPGQPLISLGTTPEWSTPKSDIFLFDDFIVGSGATGNTGHVQNSQNGGSNAAGTANITGHPGIMTATTNAATNGANMFGHGAAITTGDGRILHNFLMQIPTLSDGTDTYIARIGLQEVSTATGDVTNGCYFEYTHSVNSGAYQIKTSNNSTRTTANTASTVDTNWHLYTIDVNAAGTSVSFYIDGVEVTNSPLTTNIPGNTRFFADGFRILKSAGTNARTLNIDFSSLWKKITSNRY